MIEKGSDTFSKIARYVLVDIGDKPSPIDYREIMNSIAWAEKRANDKLSEDAKRAVVWQVESYVDVKFSDNDIIVESEESKRRPKWWSEKGENRPNYYTGSYLRYLNEDPSTEKMRNKDVIDRTEERADTVLDKLFDPTDPALTKEDRRGMVMGHVQSGKTSSYSMLINKAADAGFRFIIVLTGTIELLRQQTQKRLTEAFVGEKEEPVSGAENRIGVGKYRKLETFSDMRPFCMTSSEVDFRSTQRKALQPLPLKSSMPIILVVKKNITALTEILNWLEGKPTAKQSLLMIDDEADAASVSTKGSDDPTKINGKIREILNKFGKRAYVGYTATPFANIFIDPLYGQDYSTDVNDGYGLDLYPKDFIISLLAPDGYMGAERIFGGDEDEFSEFLIPIADWDKEFPWSQKSADLHLYANKLPDSLEDAVRLFMMNIAIRDLRGADDKNNSMLVHASRLTAVHAKTVELLREFVSKTANDIVNYSGMSENSAEYRRSVLPFKTLFEAMSTNGYSDTEDESYGKGWANNTKYGTFGWTEVLSKLRDIVGTVNVGGAYSGIKEIEYPKKGRVNIIGVGGNSLARGFTLEDLSVSYFTRNTKMCDTLLQMGRWFGYRMRFDDLCRVFMPEECIMNFKYATMSSLDLVRSITKMNDMGADPKEFLVTIATHPASSLVLTAANKSRNSSYGQGMRLDGDLFENGHINVTHGINPLNKEEAFSKLEEFVKGFEKAPDIDKKNGYLWSGISGKKIIDFLKAYPISVQMKYDREYFEKYLTKNSGMEWDVALINRPNDGRAKTAIAGLEVYKAIRKYRKDSDNKKISMSIKEDECIGLDLSPEQKNQKELRKQVRKSRENPMLVINIVDVYMREEDGSALSMKNIPLLTITFPGSFDAPKMKPLFGLVWNDLVKRQLQLDIEGESDEYEQDLQEV